MATDDQEDILNKIKAWAVPGLGSVVLLLLTIQGNNAIKRMDDVTERMSQLATKYEVANAQATYLATCCRWPSSWPWVAPCSTASASCWPSRPTCTMPTPPTAPR